MRRTRSTPEFAVRPDRGKERMHRTDNRHVTGGSHSSGPAAAIRPALWRRTARPYGSCWRPQRPRPHRAAARFWRRWDAGWRRTSPLPWTCRRSQTPKWTALPSAARTFPTAAAELRVVDPIPAGAVAAPLEPGTAAPIMTGAMIPPGADAVVPIERAVPDSSRVPELLRPSGCRQRNPAPTSAMRAATSGQGSWRSPAEPSWGRASWDSWQRSASHRSP